MVEAFPLSWPIGFARNTGEKVSSQFKCTLGQARDGVKAEIERMRGTAVIISSNIPTKANGDMYASARPVDNDHGVAVYFTWKGDQVVLACDRYITIRENLRAIEKSIEAMRGLDRWGCSDILSRAFSGFKALPTGSGVVLGKVKRHWYEVLEVTIDAEKKLGKKQHRLLSKRYHPDNGPEPNAEKFQEVQEAWKELASLPF